jgi:NTP pyrophosphatase (non-canonical NTP hydrolase)
MTAEAQSRSTPSLSDLQQTIAHFADERDWRQFHTPKNLSMAIAAEAGELMEPLLWCDAQDVAFLDDPKRRKDVEEEIADILIYSLQFATVCGIDPARAIEAKIEKNARNYPVEKARGKATKYTEL